MSSDGVQKPSWYGSAFPHLLHGPNFQSGAPSQSYGDYRKQQAEPVSHGPVASSDVHTRAGHGTWNGPAPRGVGEKGIAQLEAAREAASRGPVSEPKTTFVGGEDFPMVGLSTEQVKTEEEIRSAAAAGYRLFINSPSAAGTEAIVGAGLKDIPRSELFVVSKIPNDCHRPDAVRESCKRSLADLGCGHLDLLIMEWPVAWVPGTQEVDTTVTLSNTWAAMEGLVNDGLVKAIGVSNFGVAQTEEIMAGCSIKPVVNQVELHPLLAQRKMVGVLFRKGVQCIAGQPLALASPDLMISDVVSSVADELDKNPSEVILKWNTQRGVPVVCPMGAKLPVDLASFFSWKLSNDQKAKLDGLDKHTRFLTPSWHNFEDPEQGGATKPSTVL